MRTKDGSVNLEGLESTVRDALSVMETCRRTALKVLSSGEMVVTSARDGKHREHSLHYVGQAVDLRTRDFVDMWVQYLRQALGEDWDVVAEKDHIHCEYDPK